MTATTEVPETIKVDATPANVVHLTATQLADAIAMVKPHLGKDDSLPMLRSYRLDVLDGALWVSATDRYSLGTARIQPEARNARTGLAQAFSPQFCAVIPADVAHRAVAIFKADRRNPMADLQLAIRVTEHQVIIEDRPASDARACSRLAADVPVAPPDILDLVRACFEKVSASKDRVASSAFNARFLNRFAGVPNVLGGKNGPPILLRQATASSPLIVTCEDRFIGMLMPVRFVADEPSVDVWVKRLARSTGKAKRS